MVNSTQLLALNSSVEDLKRRIEDLEFEARIFKILIFALLDDDETKLRVCKALAKKLTEGKIPKTHGGHAL
jgi:hypothetical protein